MADKLYEIFKSIILSPELISVIIIGLLKILFLSPFLSFGNEVKNNSIILNTTIPVIGFLIVFAFTNGQKILQPKDKNKVLYQWKHFWKIKYRVYISYVFILVSAIVFCIVLFFNKAYSPDIIAFLFGFCLCVPVITNILLFINAQKVNEILEIHL